MPDTYQITPLPKSQNDVGRIIKIPHPTLNLHQDELTKTFYLSLASLSKMSGQTVTKLTWYIAQENWETRTMSIWQCNRQGYKMARFLEINLSLEILKKFDSPVLHNLENYLQEYEHYHAE